MDAGRGPCEQVKNDTKTNTVLLVVRSINISDAKEL